MKKVLTSVLILQIKVCLINWVFNISFNINFIIKGTKLVRKGKKIVHRFDWGQITINIFIRKGNQHYNEPVSRLLSAPRQHFVGPTFKISEKMSSPWLELGLLTYKHQHLYHQIKGYFVHCWPKLIYIYEGRFNHVPQINKMIYKSRSLLFAD